MPCEFRLRTWLPEIPAYTEWISQPAISSASSTARWIDCTVDSMLTTTPFFRPRDGCDADADDLDRAARRELADDAPRPSTCRCRGRRSGLSLLRFMAFACCVLVGATASGGTGVQPTLKPLV